jgi:hypothetical protein
MFSCQNICLASSKTLWQSNRGESNNRKDHEVAFTSPALQRQQVSKTTRMKKCVGSAVPAQHRIRLAA